MKRQEATTTKLMSRTRCLVLPWRDLTSFGLSESMDTKLFAARTSALGNYPIQPAPAHKLAGVVSTE